MSAIDAVRAHYESFTGAGRNHIEIPEWGTDGKPLIVYWKPVTLQTARIALGTDRSTSQFNAELVTLMAEDEAGKKLFDGVSDAMLLSSFGAYEIVAKIANAMLRAPKVEDALKN